MKTLIVSTSDIKGGAARAAYRLHLGLKLIGVSSRMLVQEKSSIDRHVLGPKTKLSKGLHKIRPTFNILPLNLYPRYRTETLFSPQWLPDQLGIRKKQLKPDIINFHWICNGFIRPETIGQVDTPVVFTLHDMWTFTGGCHYSGDCDRYQENCGSCPILGSIRDSDLSRRVWNRKLKAWSELRMVIVAPSCWLFQSAKDSSLLKDKRIELIPYGIDTNIFKPIETQTARDILGLPQDVILIAFTAMNALSDPRKGANYLKEALEVITLKKNTKDYELIVVGSEKPEVPFINRKKTNYLGLIKDEITMALTYSAADVFVAPSIQDNLPLTVIEAMACGTPTVAFEVGGMIDLITHKENGYLAKPFEVEDLAKGIQWVTESRERHQFLSVASRTKAEREYKQEHQAMRYLEIFKDLAESK